jgi:hypothetical protein
MKSIQFSNLKNQNLKTNSKYEHFQKSKNNHKFSKEEKLK